MKESATIVALFLILFMIVITGVSSGIGQALFTQLVSSQTLVGCSRRSVTVPSATHHHFCCDVRETTAFFQSVRCLVEQTGERVTTLILNAGIGTFGPLSQCSTTDVHTLFDTNTLAPIECVTRFLSSECDDIRSQSGVKIIFMGSIAGKKLFRSGALYQATKFALRGFALSVAKEYPHKEVSVFLLNPSLVATPFFSDGCIPFP